MKPRMRIAFALYPRAWRERYAREFTALLEEVGPGWRECWDVARGGLKMRLLTWNVSNVTMVCALVGAAIGGGVSLRLPDRYVSEAVIRIAGGARFEDMQRVLSRPSLVELLVKEDLYPDQRRSMPLDAVAHEAQRHIRVAVAAGKNPNERVPAAVAISFEYANRDKAQQFTRALTERFALLPGAEVLDPASLPYRPASPNRLVITLFGLAAGMLAGALTFWVRRRRLSPQSA